MVFTATFSFAALVHTFNGDVWMSAFITLLIVVLLYILPLRLAYFKSKKVRKQVGRAHEDKWQEKAILGVYAIMAVPLFILVCHFINVEFHSKNRFKHDGLEGWNEVRRLETDYAGAISQKINILDANARSAYSQYQSASGATRKSALNTLNGFLGTSATEMSGDDFNNALSTKKNALQASHSLETFKAQKQVDAKVQEAEAAIKNWNLMKVGYYFDESDKVFNAMLSETKAKLPGFDYKRESSPDKALNSPLGSLMNGGTKVMVLSLLIAVLTNLCVLAPYLSADRARVGLIGTDTFEGPSGITIRS